MKFFIFLFVALYGQIVFAEGCISKSSATDIIQANLGSDEFYSMDSFTSFEKSLRFYEDENIYRYSIGAGVNSEIILEVTCLGSFSEHFNSWPD